MVTCQIAKIGPTSEIAERCPTIMTILATPTISVRLLLGVICSHAEVGEPWINGRNDRYVKFYSRGMWALEEGIIRLKHRKGKSNVWVWFPDYFCNEALGSVRNNNVNLKFYPVTNRLNPDWKKIVHIVKKQGPPDVFILVHYFGFPNTIEEAGHFCKECGAELIEDCAHVLVPLAGSCKNVAIFSPRKLLPIPEGGLLLVRDNTFQENAFRPSFQPDKKKMLGWLSYRMSQRLMLKIGVPLHRVRRKFSSASPMARPNLTKGEKKRLPDKFMMRFLSAVEKDIPQIIEKRRKNYITCLNEANKIKALRALYPVLPDNVCPYAFPVMVPPTKRISIQKRLNRAGIPASTWPDLPPEITAHTDSHETAIWMQERLLLLPIHQDLTNSQINYMWSMLEVVLHEVGRK